MAVELLASSEHHDLLAGLSDADLADLPAREYDITVGNYSPRTASQGRAKRERWSSSEPAEQAAQPSGAQALPLGTPVAHAVPRMGGYVAAPPQQQPRAVVVTA